VIVQLAIPTVAVGDKEHFAGLGLNMPGLSLAYVTVPNGVVGLFEESVRVAVHKVTFPRLIEPGEHVTDAVVEWLEVGVVT